MKTFGEFLRNEREYKEVSLRELAEAAGISPSYLSIVERDVASPPSDRVIEALEDALELSRGELLGHSDRVPRELIKMLSRRPVLRDLVVAYSAYSDEEIAVILGDI